MMKGKFKRQTCRGQEDSILWDDINPAGRWARGAATGSFELLADLATKRGGGCVGIGKRLADWEPRVI